jgi:ABC-type bacteriocin/lantibiotic exporter with double-glycine peptidase domain
MKTLNFMKQITIIFFIVFSITGCSHKNSNGQTFDEKIFQSYLDSNRVTKYNELKEKYDNNRFILWWNKDKDAWWITNFTLWFVGLILPNMPDLLSGGVVLGIIWALGMLASGGAILGGLAMLGGMLGGFPGIAPAIMGIIWLGVIFSTLSKLFALLF